jgi:F-type H+-transporting ATPase subunit b
MFAFISNSILLFAESHGAPAAAETGAWAKFLHFYNDWFSIPGFELWKFLNLGIFIALMVYLLKKPLGDAFRAKRDQIRAELIRAEQEKQAALKELTSVEARLAQLETEKETILANARDEAAAEKQRLTENAASEAERLRKQTEAELARLTGQTRLELKRLAAERSISFAESKLRSAIDAKVDTGLVKGALSEIGGLN